MFLRVMGVILMWLSFILVCLSLTSLGGLKAYLFTTGGICYLGAIVLLILRFKEGRLPVFPVHMAIGLFLTGTVIVIIGIRVVMVLK